jgi:Amt family ammonium transporter
MNAGFAFLESGFVRAKNTVNVLAKNFVVFGLATVSFWIIGYTLMFKGNLSALFFSDVAAVTGGEGHKIPEVVFFFFQLAFAATAASIVSGAVVERIKLISYIVFSLLLVAFIYPVIGLATWGGGFLSELGFVDFAGSTVVHSVGGWAALAGIILLGARREKFKGGRINVIPGHSMPLATLGTFILWLGWFGFNPGSQLAMDGMVPVIAVNTNLAAVFGMLTATVLSWAKFGKPDFAMILNGLLGGLVAITAGCAAVNFGSAAIIGTIAGAVVFFGVPFFERMKLDDPVGVTSVHLLCGIAGTFLVGFFATDGGLFYGGGIDLILKQLAGIGFTGGVVFFGSLFLWYIIKITMGLRVSDKEEMEGLDYGEMGYEAYMFTETK